MNPLQTAFPNTPAGPPPGVFGPNILDAIKQAYAGGVPPPSTDPYTDIKGLLDLHEQCRKDAFNETRYLFERIWWRNHLYFVNRHWIKWDRTRGWVDKRLKPWMPRPVTNKVKETHDAIASVFASVRLDNRAVPINQSPKNITTAEIANRIEPFIQAEHEMQRVMREFDFNLILYGTAHLWPWWDSRRENGMLVVPWEVCNQCQSSLKPEIIKENGDACPMCGHREFTPSKDDFDEIPKGKGTTDAPSPFEIAAPMTATSWDAAPYIYRLRWRTRRWIEKNYDPEVTDKINWQTTPSERSLQLLRSIPSQTDLGASQFSYGAVTGGGFGDEEGISEYELWHKPNDKYPEGLVCRYLGESSPVVVESDAPELPGPFHLRTAKGMPFLPLVTATYRHINGRLYGEGAIDPMIDKQNQLNRLDALTELMAMRMSNPVWLEPEGMNVKHFTGEPGLVVKYTPLVVGSQIRPERIAGENIPQSLMKLREQYLADIESMTGTYDVIKGDRPTNVQAFSAMQLLVERSQSRFAVPLQARGEAGRRVFKMQLELERQFGPETRTYAALNPVGAVDVQAFKNADLSGDIDIIVEDGSTTPKTNLGQRAAIDQLAQLGLLDRQNPGTVYEVHKIYGTTTLMPHIDVNVKRALREQFEFEQYALSLGDQEPQPPMDPTTGQPAIDPQSGQPLVLKTPFERMPWHDDQIHLAQHTLWGNSDVADRLFATRPILQAAFAAHLQEHTEAAQAKMMAAQGGGLAPKPKGAAGAAQALTNSNRESGNPADATPPGAPR